MNERLCRWLDATRPRKAGGRYSPTLNSCKRLAGGPPLPKLKLARHTGYSQDWEKLLRQISFASAAELKEEHDTVCVHLKKHGRVELQIPCGQAFEIKLWEWAGLAVYLYHFRDVDSSQVVLLHIGIIKDDYDGEQLRRIRHVAVQRLSEVLGGKETIFLT
jgi:hypothetical protein